MAVQSDTSRIQYTGNNSTVTSYAVPFVFLENNHLSAVARVTATGVESAVALTNHTGVGDINGGTVRTAVAVPATSTLAISRTVPATQTTQYQEGGDFPAASHERALDKLTMAVQQVARSVARTVRLTDGAPDSAALLSVPSRYFGTDDTGAIALVSGTDSPAGTLTNANIASDAAILGSKLADASIAANTKLTDGTITTSKITTGAVTTPKILDSNVTTVKIADSNVTTAKIATGAVTTPKILDLNVTSAKIAVGAVTPDKLERPYTLATAQPSTSGVSVDFIGTIPSWAKRITVMFHNVSTSGTSGVVVRVGAGSFLTTSYAAGGTDFTGAATATEAETSGLPLSDPPDLIGDIYSGVATIVTLGSNVWAMSSIVRCGGNRMGMGAASIEVGGTLDRVQVATINGTDTFDGGTINISYE